MSTPNNDLDAAMLHKLTLANIKVIQASYPRFLPSGYGAPEIIISRKEDGELYAAVISVQINRKGEENNIAIVCNTRATVGLVHDIDALRNLHQQMQKELDITLRSRLEGETVRDPPVPFAFWRDIRYSHVPGLEETDDYGPGFSDPDSPGYDN